MSVIKKVFYLPGLPHPLLAPEKNPGYQRLRDGFELVRNQVQQLNPDVLIIYSTMWPSILGHQVQTAERCEWVHVDDDFHDLGSIPYAFQMDKLLGESIVNHGRNRGLQMKAVDYHGFPLDTGTVTCLKLLNPDPSAAIPAVILSSNVYADRSETVVLGKATVDALLAQKKTAVLIAIGTLSNRIHQENVPMQSDRIHSLKDQEWNLKILELFKEGRLEDLAQLSRQIQKEARVKKVNNFKPLWWLAASTGESNRFRGEVLAYEPVMGTGCAIVGLTPADQAARDLEFDENSPDQFLGERNVLESMSSQTLEPGRSDV